jgi:hypothetical protein
MVYGETPRNLRPLLREAAQRAYETEMTSSLHLLEGAFDDWKAGKVSAADLSQRIDKWNRGEGKRIEERYAWSNMRELEMLVAWAVVDGTLGPSLLPEQLLQHLQRLIEALTEIGRTGRRA